MFSLNSLTGARFILLLAFYLIIFQEVSAELPLYHLSKASSIKNNEAPLLILLHGYGSNEEDLFSFASELDNRYTILSVRAPYTMPYGGYAWFNIDFTPEGIKVYDEDEIQSSLNTIKEFIEKAKVEYNIGSQKVILAGFSQGAVLSYLLGLSKPEMIDGVLAMSGFIRQNSLANTASNEKLEKLAICITHGTEDPVIPIGQARESKKYLESLGLQFEYHEYPMAHGLSPECLKDIIKWTTEQIN